MDDTAREIINKFLAQYETLAIATEHEGQPYVTRAFFVEEPVNDTTLKLYCPFITTSRKLANLRQNPRVGLFIGPTQPTVWLEATAQARVLEDEQASTTARENLGKKARTAAMFIARVPIVAVELRVNWLRITYLTASPTFTDATVDTTSLEVDQQVRTYS